MVVGERLSQGLSSLTLPSTLAASRDTTTPEHPPSYQGKPQPCPLHASGAHCKANTAQGKEMVAATYPLQPLELSLTKRGRNSFASSVRPCRKEAEISFRQKHQQVKTTSLYLTSTDMAVLKQGKSICPTPAHRGN